MDFRLPLGEWVETFVDWITVVAAGFFDVIRTIFDGFFEALYLLVGTAPWWVMIVIFVVLALVIRSWRFALGTAVGFLLIVGVDQWDNAMRTFALVLEGGIIAIAMSIPLGIWAARSDRVSNALRPILDFMQTMPAFVYLIPAIVLFSVGVVPGLVATVVFALAPGVRLTELGIRGVDSEIVEAGQAFGASPARILRQIQLPLALPSIMAGINQVIMLALSMVVISGMVGAGGLGEDVVQALNRIDVALGFEAGLSVVILAIYLDRLTAALGRPRRRKKSSAPAASPADQAAVAQAPDAVPAS